MDTNASTGCEFIDKHYVPRYYEAESIAEITSSDARSKIKLLRHDLGELRLVQLESVKDAFGQNTKNDRTRKVPSRHA